MRYTISFIAASLVALAFGTARAEVPVVVTDIPPVHSLVAQVMGDLGQPVLLLDKGSNAHSFQLRPSQAGVLSDAELVVWIGPEMTPWLEDALDSLAPDSTHLGLLAAKGTLRRSFDAPAGGDHAHDDPADEAGHDHDGADPHAWLDPVNARLWLGLIASELARIDPPNAATYQANAATARAEVAALDARLAAALAPVRDRPFVVFHDAYGYFTDHYGLTLAGTVALGDAAAPGAAHLAKLQGLLGDALCIFPEPQHDPKLVETLAADTGARLGAPLDPEGAGMEPGPAVYAAILTGLADTLLDCLAAN